MNQKYLLFELFLTDLSSPFIFNKKNKFETIMPNLNFSSSSNISESFNKKIENDKEINNIVLELSNTLIQALNKLSKFKNIFKDPTLSKDNKINIFAMALTPLGISVHENPYDIKSNFKIKFSWSDELFILSQKNSRFKEILDLLYDIYVKSIVEEVAVQLHITNNVLN